MAKHMLNSTFAGAGLVTTLMAGLISASAVMFAPQAQAQSESSEQPERRLNLMLMGSAPQVCSSMNQDACADKDWIQANEMRTARVYNLSDVRRREAMRQAVWPREREAIREELIEALEMMADHFGYGVVPEHRLIDRFRSRAHLDLLSRLTEDEYYRVLDGLEMPTVEGLREVARVSESPNTSAQLLQRFVSDTQRFSGQETPVIYIVTAAQRDPLGSYLSQAAALRSAGAEPRWLPIDATVMRAEGRCDSIDSLRRRGTGAYDRARVHPQLHAQQVEFCESRDSWSDALNEADGVYFVDGNQSLLRDAFINSDGQANALLQSIQNKLNAGQLNVAAAGNAAIAMSSATMVTNGTSRDAMVNGSLARQAPAIGCEQDDSCPRDVGPDTLTYNPLGGLGLYSFGMIDVELSERGRQARMLRLAADTVTPVAIGIDRDTAILVNPSHGVFEVLGDAAVFVALQATGNANMVGGGFHFLYRGAMGRIQRSAVTDISLAQQPAFRPESITTRFLGDTGVFDNIARLCEGREQLQLLQDDFVFLMQRTDNTTAEGRRGRCQVINGVVGIGRN